MECENRERERNVYRYRQIVDMRCNKKSSEFSKLNDFLQTK